MTIDELEAGPDLDALIAEKVMGLVIDHDFRDDNSPVVRVVSADVTFIEPCPGYSTNIAAAWEVVEKLKSLDWEIEVSVTCKLPDGDSETYYCGLQQGDDNAPWSKDYRYLQTWAPMAPLAICRAALKAIHA